jgi:hypothetical protein
MINFTNRNCISKADSHLIWCRLFWDYQATAIVQEAQPLSQSMHTTVKSFIEQQQYVFDTLWNKAIPAKQRIKEIEEGLKREFIETIRDLMKYRYPHAFYR